MQNFEYVKAVYESYTRSTVEQQISPTDTMFNEWYWPVGKSAVEAIVAGMLASKLTRVERLLDMPCGHGRVARHLRAMFPQAQLDCCDLDVDGVNFCAATFDANPVFSQEELTQIDFQAEYDLIWVGSLFTHTSRAVTQRWMAHLAQFLSPTGIIVATVHGRWCQQVHKHAPYMAEERWQEVVQEFEATGYGYRDYAQSENHSYISGSYGVSMAQAQVTVGDIVQIPNVRLFLYTERGWADHQDVVVFGRPRHDEPWT
jgi:SAM-dependent methyltransferase